MISPRGEPRQPAALLRLGAEHDEALAADADVGAEERAEGRRGLAELEGDPHLLLHGEAEAAVLLGDGKAEEAERAHLRDDVRRGSRRRRRPRSRAGTSRSRTKRRTVSSSWSRVSGSRAIGGQLTGGAAQVANEGALCQVTRMSEPTSLRCPCAFSARTASPSSPSTIRRSMRSRRRCARSCCGCSARWSDESDVRGIVLIGAGRDFVAGADIREMDMAPLEPSLPEVILAIEACRQADRGGDPRQRAGRRVRAGAGLRPAAGDRGRHGRAAGGEARHHPRRRRHAAAAAAGGRGAGHRAHRGGAASRGEGGGDARARRSRRRGRSAGGRAGGGGAGCEAAAVGGGGAGRR